MPERKKPGPPKPDEVDAVESSKYYRKLAEKEKKEKKEKEKQDTPPDPIGKVKPGEVDPTFFFLSDEGEDEPEDPTDVVFDV